MNYEKFADDRNGEEFADDKINTVSIHGAASFELRQMPNRNFQGPPNSSGSSSKCFFKNSQHCLFRNFLSVPNIVLVHDCCGYSSAHKRGNVC